ncbi:MAG: ABC transporter substrate-binding protein [Oscillospiraceae bacterium]|nr:ABC transporter substrate-binding protein [Oscillospiraceae bacterium]
MKHNLKRMMALLLALVMLMSLCACGGEDEEEDDSTLNIDPNQSSVAVKAADAVFSLGYDADQSLNPLRTSSQANYIVDCLVYEFAVDLDPDYNVIYNIITSADSDNGISWMLKIDPTVTFHDGSTVTAEDVAYSIDQARKSDIYGARLNKIWGISAFNDSDQVMISLSDVNQLFPRNLNIPIIKKGSDSTMPEGTGQYMFDTDMTKLVKYEEHRFADSTPLDVIYLHDNGSPDEKIAAYSSSVVDIAVNDPTSLSRLGYGSQNEVRHFATTNMQYIGFNVNEEFTCYPQMRKAISFAVNRAYIVDSIYNGSAVEATLPIPPTNDLYNQGLAEQYEFDLIKAQREFQVAGVQDFDADGMCEYQLPGGIAEIDVEMIVAADNTDKVKAAKRIVEDLNAIGIPVKLKQLSWSDYVNAIVYKEYDMFYGEIKLPPDFSLMDMLSTNGVKNFYNMSDPNVYEVILNYLSAKGDTERKNNCDAMCRYIMDNAYIIPILFEEQQVLTHRDVVQGMNPTQYNLFYGFQNWVIDPTAGLVDADGDGDLDLAEIDESATPEPENTKRPIPTQSAAPTATPDVTETPTPTPETTPDEEPSPTPDEEKPTPTPQTSMNRPQEG